jgi:hypothetical protein
MRETEGRDLAGLGLCTNFPGSEIPEQEAEFGRRCEAERRRKGRFLTLSEMYHIALAFAHELGYRKVCGPSASVDSEAAQFFRSQRAKKASKTRNNNLTPEERSAHAKKMAEARWKRA